MYLLSRWYRKFVRYLWFQGFFLLSALMPVYKKTYISKMYILRVHAPVVQTSPPSLLGPAQSEPPACGAGFVQLLDFDLTHLASQSELVHDVQPPLIGTGFVAEK